MEARLHPIRPRFIRVGLVLLDSPRNSHSLDDTKESRGSKAEPNLSHTGQAIPLNCVTGPFAGEIAAFQNCSRKQTGRKGWGKLCARTLSIEPGCPCESGCNGSFNSMPREERLKGEIFYSLKEV